LRNLSVAGTSNGLSDVFPVDQHSNELKSAKPRFAYKCP
jgi:hypothetical protein